MAKKLSNEFPTFFKYAEKTMTVGGQKHRTLYDPETGEVVELEQTFKAVFGYQNFWKFSIVNFIDILDVFNNQQVKVFQYILKNTKASDNLFHGTHRQIAKNVQCSLYTVQNIISSLIKANFFVRIQNGVYLVNPELMVKGNEAKRMKLIEQYQAAKFNKSLLKAGTDPKTETSAKTDTETNADTDNETDE